MSDQAWFVRQMVLFPADDDPAALGLLLADDAEGARLSVVVDAEWVRTALAGIAAGVELALMEVPEEVRLPVAASGWPEDWDDDDEAQVLDMSERLRAAPSWALLRSALEASLEGDAACAPPASGREPASGPDGAARAAARRFSEALGKALDDEVEGLLLYRSDDDPYDDPGVSLSAVALAAGDLLDQAMDDWWDVIQPVIEDEQIDAMLQELTPFVPPGGLGWGSISVEGGGHIASDDSLGA
jgi:hypothetical protein